MHFFKENSSFLLYSTLLILFLAYNGIILYLLVGPNEAKNENQKLIETEYQRESTPILSSKQNRQVREFSKTGIENLQKNEQDCGVIDENSSNKYPWLVSIHLTPITAENLLKPICSGTLITRRHIITAAQCLEGLSPRDILVRFGNNDLDIDLSDDNHLDYHKVDQFRWPALYCRQTHTADIAVIRLEKRLSDKYRAICLPKENSNLVNKDATLIGYGLFNDKNGTIPVEEKKFSKLLETEVTIWNNSDYKKVYNILVDKQLCASHKITEEVVTFKSNSNEEDEENYSANNDNNNNNNNEIDNVIDACVGDGGAPLQIKLPTDKLGRERMELVGLAIYSVNCARKNYPTVYTKVSSYLNWINDNTKDLLNPLLTTNPFPMRPVEQKVTIKANLYHRERIMPSNKYTNANDTISGGGGSKNSSGNSSPLASILQSSLTLQLPDFSQQLLQQQQQQQSINKKPIVIEISLAGLHGRNEGVTIAVMDPSSDLDNNNNNKNDSLINQQEQVESSTTNSTTIATLFDEPTIQEKPSASTKPTISTTQISNNNNQPLSTGVNNNNNNFQINEKNCGQLQTNDKELEKTRIIGGDVSGPNDFPWMVAIISSNPSNSEVVPFCGGSLITRRHILTAAHCLKDLTPADVLVRLGNYDFNETSSSSVTADSDFAIDQFKIHKSYNKETHNADIAIIRLKTPLSSADNFNTICLPKNLRLSYINSLATVIGYGEHNVNRKNEKYVPVLRQVLVPILDNKHCSQLYKRNLTEGYMCAGEGNKDSCQGDSGGPLMIYGANDEYVEVGIISFGLTSKNRECGKENNPGVYTRVSHYMDWITKNIRD